MMEIDSGKLFIGGISWETTEERLRDYFQTYGEVVEALIMKDRMTGRGRGFGFIVFANASVAEKVLKERHFIDGRAVEAKRAVPRDDHQNSNKANGSSIQGSPSPGRAKKIFVGGLAATITETEFKKYFDRFGTITDVVVMYDHNTQRPRGFGFITFDSEEAVNKVLVKTFHDLNGKMVEVKVAVPKDSSPGTGRNLTSYHNYGLNRLSNLLNGYTQGHSSGSAGEYGLRLDDRFGPVSVGSRNGYPPYSPSKYTLGLNLNPGLGLNYGAVGDSSFGYVRGMSSPYARNLDRQHVRNELDFGGNGLLWNTAGHNMLGDGKLGYGTTPSNVFGSSGNGSAGIGGSFGLIKDIWDTSLSSSQLQGNDSFSNGSLSYENWENNFCNRKTYIRNNESISTSKPSQFTIGTSLEEEGMNMYQGDSFFEDNAWLSTSLEPTGSTSFTYGHGSLLESVPPSNSAGYGGHYNTLTRSDRGIAA